MRPAMDTRPRPPSPALAGLVVAALVLGTGIAVVRYLDAAGSGSPLGNSAVLAAPPSETTQSPAATRTV